MASNSATHPQSKRVADAPVTLPRIAITYCTQCRWMLRAAYFAQELLSTFSTTIGEIALIPATGGIFTVSLTYQPTATGIPEEVRVGRGEDKTIAADIQAENVLIWDRKAEGGFPETKVLKQRVRDYLEPSRDLGHLDKHGKSQQSKPVLEHPQTEGPADIPNVTNGIKTDAAACEDCQTGQP